MTVEVLFNPLIGLLDRGGLSLLRPSHEEPAVVTVGQLFNPLLELEQRQQEDCHPIISFEALNDVVAMASSSSSSSSSSSNRRRNNRLSKNHHHHQIELSSLDKLATEDADENDELSSCNSCNNDDPKQQQRKVVRFSKVQNVVHWIPSHREYNQSERDRIWSNPEEIEYNACRNRIEFRYEGYQWRNVLDETKFVLCSDGQLYHPITVELFLRQLQREQQQQQQQQRKQAQDDEAIRMVSRKRKRIVVVAASSSAWIIRVEEASTTAKRQRMLSSESVALLQ